MHNHQHRQICLHCETVRRHCKFHGLLANCGSGTLDTLLECPGMYPCSTETCTLCIGTKCTFECGRSPGARMAQSHMRPCTFCILHHTLSRLSRRWLCMLDLSQQRHSCIRTHSPGMRCHPYGTPRRNFRKYLRCLWYMRHLQQPHHLHKCMCSPGMHRRPYGILHCILRK